MYWTSLFTGLHVLWFFLQLSWPMLWWVTKWLRKLPLPPLWSFLFCSIPYDYYRTAFQKSFKCMLRSRELKSTCLPDKWRMIMWSKFLSKIAKQLSRLREEIFIGAWRIKRKIKKMKIMRINNKTSRKRKIRRNLKNKNKKLMKYKAYHRQVLLWAKAVKKVRAN